MLEWSQLISQSVLLNRKNNNLTVIEPQQNPLQPKVLKQEIRKLSNRKYVLCNVVKYVRIVYNEDGSRTEEPYILIHPIYLFDYQKSRYMPHQGKKELERRRLNSRHRDNNLPEGKPVQ